MGYLIYRMSGVKENRKERRVAGFSIFMLFTILLSLLPDFDSILGILLNDMQRYHNNFVHSLVFSLGTSFLIAGAGWLFYRARFIFWFLVSFSSYTMHILMDSATQEGRGVMLFWPFTTHRYISPVTLFYGVQWSDGLFSPQHLITLLTEALFVLLIVFIVWLLENRRSRSQFKTEARPSNNLK